MSRIVVRSGKRRLTELNQPSNDIDSHDDTLHNSHTRLTDLLGLVVCLTLHTSFNRLGRILLKYRVDSEDTRGDAQSQMDGNTNRETDDRTATSSECTHETKHTEEAEQGEDGRVYVHGYLVNDVHLVILCVL